MAASFSSQVRCDGPHLCRGQSLRPLVEVVFSAGSPSRNVRIPCTFMPYHHKAPQQSLARHATIIVYLESRARGACYLRSRVGPRRWTDCFRTARPYQYCQLFEKRKR
ncbi:unnamed protein product [Leptosia nina]|uniref:Uncharacterized protein n=1 Tax=Leptosia nina TaxID=320188 RepID=A0AAV1JZ95_9NEOP